MALKHRIHHKIKKHTDGIKGYWCQKKFWPFYAWFLIWAVIVGSVEIATIAASSERFFLDWIFRNDLTCSQDIIEILDDGAFCFQKCQNIAECAVAQRNYDIDNLPTSTCKLMRGKLPNCVKQSSTLQRGVVTYIEHLNSIRNTFRPQTINFEIKQPN